MEEGGKLIAESRGLVAEGFRDLIRALNEVSEEARTDFFVIGASARDLLLEGVYGEKVRRATRDVDVAIVVDGWKAYEAVVNTLVRRYDFIRGNAPHRLEHEKKGALDLVPFGNIEESEGSLRWPSGGARVMSTLGMREAHDNAVHVWLDGDLPVKVASLEGQALLKLVAWRDRPRERKRDAEDFCLLLRSYYDVRDELVYSRHLDLFAEEDFDRTETSGRIYGREVASLLTDSPGVEVAVLELLEEQTLYPETSDFVRAMSSAQCFYGRQSRYKALAGFLQGIRDGSSNKGEAT